MAGVIGAIAYVYTTTAITEEKLPPYINCTTAIAKGQSPTYSVH
jgi:hypothetical protein